MRKVERGHAAALLGKCAITALPAVRPPPLPRSVEPFVAAALASTQGQRPSMEDRHLLCAELTRARKWDFEDGCPTSVFGVFDGHGGETAAAYCADHLLEFLAVHLPNLPALDLGVASDVATLQRGFVIAFKELDDAFLQVANDPLLEQPNLSGSTALLVVLQKQEWIVVANLGDSRAVLSRNGRAVALSNDHKPGNPTERERIERAGGWITESLELDVSRLIKLNPRFAESKSIPEQLAKEEIGFIPTFRLNGELLVSRAIGDVETKGELKNEFWEDRAFSDDIVSCEPEVLLFARSVHDEFIVLACDGLWDVMSNDEVVEFVRDRLAQERDSAARLVRSVEETCSPSKVKEANEGPVKRVASELVAEALKRGSLDNISVW